VEKSTKTFVDRLGAFNCVSHASTYSHQQIERKRSSERARFCCYRHNNFPVDRIRWLQAEAETKRSPKVPHKRRSVELEPSLYQCSSTSGIRSVKRSKIRLLMFSKLRGNSSQNILLCGYVCSVWSLLCAPLACLELRYGPCGRLGPGFVVNSLLPHVDDCEH
jgi:hypothetical protein